MEVPRIRLHEELSKTLTGTLRELGSFVMRRIQEPPQETKEMAQASIQYYSTFDLTPKE